MLSADDVGDVLGAVVVPEIMGTSIDAPQPVGCNYIGDSGSPHVLVEVRFGKGHWQGTSEYWLDTKQDPVAIEGLGDAAYLDSGHVIFVSGEWFCSLLRIEGEVSDEDLTALALLLESKLP